MRKLIYLFFLPLFLIHFSARAQQPGSLDLSFNPSDEGFAYGEGANFYIKDLALQANGKIILVGQFTLYGVTQRGRIARIHPDGSLDTTFAMGTGANGILHAVTLQTDGKILIGGNFTSYNGIPINRIARLNADGSLDSTFNPGTGASSEVTTIVEQPDNKILIAGDFTQVNGAPHRHIARLNPDGSLDTSFSTGGGANEEIYAVALQPDGKIIIGGVFQLINGSSHSRIARLNSDGTIDVNFNPGAGANNFVYTLALQQDGKIIVGGSFTIFNGTSSNHITRLNNDGTIDNTFTAGSGTNGPVTTAIIRPDGSIFILGGFSSYNNIISNRAAKLNPNGTYDATFNPGSGFSSNVESVAFQPDGKIIFGGLFNKYYGFPRYYLVRTHPDGTPDPSFLPQSGSNGAVLAAIQQPDGKIIIAGSFSLYNNTAISGIARINQNGSLDTSFNPGLGTDFPIFVVKLLPDGKILIGGSFQNVNGVPRRGLARLNSDGSLDSSFDPGAGPGSGDIYTISTLPDGKLIVGGGFIVYNNLPYKGVVRLNPNGTLDTSFNTGTGVGGFFATVVYSTAIQADGKILIGGYFTSVNGTNRPYIARLNANGSLDTSFSPGNGANDIVLDVKVLPDGKVLIAGKFTAVNSTPRNRIARLNANGTIDASFNSGNGANDNISTTLVQPDGKIIIGGDFISYDGANRQFLTRLTADGAYDPGFDTGTGPNSGIRMIMLQADGKIIIGGHFTSYNGIGRNRIARVETGVVISGVSEIEQHHVQVFPNPFKSSFLLQVPGTGKATVSIVNLTGQVMYSETFNTNSTESPIEIAPPSDLPPGMYLIHVQQKEFSSIVRALKQ